MDEQHDPPPIGPPINLPARFDQDAVAKMAKQLSNMVRGYARDRARLRSLATFGARSKGDRVRMMAQVEWRDRPEVELYLEHRDSYQSMAKEVEAWREKIMGMEGDGVATAMAALARIEFERSKHLVSMEGILVNLQKEFVTRETVMSRLMAEAVKMQESARQHEDRIEVLERIKNLDPSAESSEDKIAKLARTMGVPEAEIRRQLEESLHDDDRAVG